MAIDRTIAEKYGSLAKFAETVWEHMPGITQAHPHDPGDGEEGLWKEITVVCQDLLGKRDGQEAATLLRNRGFFSIVFPD